MALSVCIVGGGTVGRALAARRAPRGDDVTVVESSADVAAELDGGPYDVRHGDGTDVSALRGAGADGADVGVAATGDDASNLHTAQLLRNRFETDRVIARVNRPTNAAAFEDLGIVTVTAADATAQAADSYIERPTLVGWIEQIGRGGDVRTVEVTAPDYADATVAELNAALPEQCLVVIVDESGTAHVPDDEVVAGDSVAVLGERGAVATAVATLDPE